MFWTENGKTQSPKTKEKEEDERSRERAGISLGGGWGGAPRGCGQSGNRPRPGRSGGPGGENEWGPGGSQSQSSNY